MITLTLREPTSPDRDVVASWFPSRDDVLLFTGSTDAWPLTGPALADHEVSVGGRAFVAVHGDEIVGHIALRGLGSEHVHLGRIAIAPSMRGRGLSAPLLDAAAEVAASGGATWLSLSVVPGNEPALRAYERVGFRDAGQNPDHPEFVWMTRDLEVISPR